MLKNRDIFFVEFVFLGAAEERGGREEIGRKAIREFMFVGEEGESWEPARRREEGKRSRQRRPKNHQ